MADDRRPEDVRVDDAVVALAQALWAVRDDHRQFLVLGSVGCLLEAFIPSIRQTRLTYRERAASKAWTN